MIRVAKRIMLISKLPLMYKKLLNFNASQKVNQRINMIYVAVVPSLILLFAPFILRPTAFLGDEPHYLIVANSILKHHTLNLKEAYMKSEGGDDDAGKVLKGQPVDHHTVFIDTSTFPYKKLGSGKYASDEYSKWHLMLSRYDYPDTIKEYSMPMVKKSSIK